LTTLFGSAAVSIKKRSLLPVLTVLFVFSYGLMTLLIVEQGNTIQSQRALIEELFQDSVQLSGMKGKAVQEKNLADAQHRAQAQAKQGQVQGPARPAAPSTPPQSSAQNEKAQNPSSQAVPQREVQNHAGKMRKPQMQMPSRPASDLADERRALVTI
jgi:hypothetical protein